MLQRLQENKSFEDDLQQALDNGEFRVYYQPIADTMSGEIYGYEALVRWFHPVRGMVPPTLFIPVAEKIGMINPLGSGCLKPPVRKRRAGHRRSKCRLTYRPFS